MNVSILLFALALSGCDTSVDSKTAADADTSSGCAETVSDASVCASDITVDWSAVSGGPTSLTAVTINLDAATAATAICGDALNQSEVSGYWSDTADEEPALASKLELSASSGQTLYLAAYAADGSVLSEGLYAIGGEGCATAVTLE